MMNNEFQFYKGGIELKRTIRTNINPPYSLHDMNVVSFEVNDNDIVMRTVSQLWMKPMDIIRQNTMDIF